MQDFIINKDSVLPILRMELIYDGRSDYNKFWTAIQDATITFTMVNVDTNITKIANANCYIKRIETEGCEPKYVICYNWNKRDTKERGVYEGSFNINFKGNLSSENVSYPVGNLIMPIKEKLLIHIQ